MANWKKDIDITSAIINLIGWIFFIIVGILSLIDIFEGSNLSLSLGKKIIGLLYVIMIIVFWPIQISYHLYVSKGKQVDTLHRIDRGSMQFLLAGIFSPIIFELVDSPGSIIVIVLLWVLAAIGMGLLLIMKNLSRKIAPLLGFTMGIIGIVSISTFITKMSGMTIFLFFMGSLFLIGGGAVYALKRPDPKLDWFGFHEIFHSLILIGCIFLHYVVLAFY